jgi:beta-glucosidase
VEVIVRRRMGVIMMSAALASAGCATAAAQEPETETETGAGVIHPELWPRGRSGAPRDAAVEAEVTRLLAAMSLEEKVGQIIQADIGTASPDDVRRLRLGSVLAGGDSGPYGDNYAPPEAWLALADAFYAASRDVPPGRPAIPALWGIDAVHGNANIVGATVFPHNIGLGATRNWDLLRRIGEITAIETRVVGLDWTFGPTLAVVRDDRWGRTYESFSEDPRIVARAARAMVEGMQGDARSAEFLDASHVLATAKHFLGDGGTEGGRDQGDTLASENDLRDIHAAGYRAAIGAGVQTVMASYSSWRGEKMHGRRDLLTDVLVGRLGFDGFVVGDWEGHGQVDGCTAQSCPAALAAGVDMYMAAGSWAGLYESTLAQARSGAIPIERLNEAVGRVLRVKLRAGLLDAGPPSQRPLAGRFELLGAAEHRAVARQAVRESLVLLKNDGGVLPLRADARVLVAGDAADDVGRQSGGWTLSWQGTGNTREHFPNATTIYEGLRAALDAGGGVAVLSPEGSFTERPDVGIVVIGETPYAEFRGDIASLDYQPDEARDLALIERLRAAGIPVVTVFLSGRPLYVTPEINASDAFVAAWLPGSEGGGVADVLVRTPDGGVGHEFRGRLGFSWPRAPDQTVNVGDRPYDPLFPVGYGLRYGRPRWVGELPVTAP